MIAVLQVALGGAIGAVLRYLAGVGMIRLFGQGTFPLPILAVNVAGSFLMGVFVVLAVQRGLTSISPLIMTGLLGGFTTFAAFSLEAVTLYERGEVGQAALYVGASVVLSILGLVTGLCLARSFYA